MSSSLFDAAVGADAGSSAVLSDDGVYRYELTRRWGPGRTATFVMLNPSTADAVMNDPTIRRCIGFSMRWGCGALRVVNLYAYRATDPRTLWATPDPVGPDNDLHLYEAASKASTEGAPLVAAWGANAKPVRVGQALRIPGFDQLSALGVTKAGQPRHPLYLRGDAHLTSWPVTA